MHVSTGGCAIATVDPATGALRWTAAPIPQACSIPPSLGGLGTHEPWVEGDVVHVGWESFVLSAPGPPRPPSYNAGTDSFDAATGAPVGHLSDGVLDTRRGPTIGTTRGMVDADGSITYTGNLRHLEGDSGFTFPGQTMKRATVGSFGTPVLFAGTDGSDQAYQTSSNEDDCGPGFAAAGCGSATCPDLWTATTDGSAITGGPIVTGGRAYAGTTKGQLFAFGLP